MIPVSPTGNDRRYKTCLPQAAGAVLRAERSSDICRDYAAECSEHRPAEAAAPKKERDHLPLSLSNIHKRPAVSEKILKFFGQVTFDFLLQIQIADLMPERQHSAR